MDKQAIRVTLEFEVCITTLYEGKSDEERANAAGLRHNGKLKRDGETKSSREISSFCRIRNIVSRVRQLASSEKERAEIKS
jgi:hypothetical protein